MKTKFYILQSFFFTLLLSWGSGEIASAQTINLEVEDFSTGGDSTTGARNNVLVYTITVTSGSNALTATLTDNIPGGTAYIPGSTLVNGVSVADVNETMPFASGYRFPHCTPVYGYKANNNSGQKNNAATRQQQVAIAAQVQPNPFHKELNLQVQLNTAEVVKIRLVDFYGRTVYTTIEKLGAGTNSLHLPVPANLGSGMYVVELWTGNKRLLNKKILKQ